MTSATIRRPGEGEKFWLVGDHVTLKIGPEQTDNAFMAAINWILPGGGPPTHIHHREDEMFYVIEGSMLVVENGQTRIGGPGATVYLKKDIPHAFKNVGESPLRFIVMTAPAGFCGFVRACGTPIIAIPSGLEVTPATIERLLRIAPDYGLELVMNGKTDGPAPQAAPERSYWVLGQLVTLKLASSQTNGQFCVAEVISPVGSDGVPPHRHVAMDEFFVVLEGTFDFNLGDRTEKLEQGATVHIPRGAVHGFRNAGPTVGRIADFHNPGGFEYFFQNAGAPCTDPTRPPAPQTPDMQKLGAIMAKVGMELA